MIKQTLGVFMVIFYFVSLYCFGYPLVYWFQNDVITKMQLFKMFWYYYLIGIGSNLFLYLTLYLEEKV